MATSTTHISSKMRTRARASWLPYAMLGAITVLGFVLRFYKLGEWSFWIDEVYTLERAQAHYTSWEGILRYLPPATNWVPTSVMLTGAAISTLGVSEWSVRLVPALIGVLSILLLYWPVKQSFGTRTALIFALLLSLSPWHVQWSQNGRFYAALMLLYTLAAFAFYFGLERNRPAYLVAGLLLFYLAMSERMIAGLIAPALAVYLLALPLLRFARPSGFNRRNFWILLAPLLAGAAFEVYNVVVTGSPRLLAEADVFIGNAIDSPVRILTLIVFGIGTPVLVMGIFGGGWMVHERSRAGLFCLANAVVPIVLLIAISPWVFVVDRYALITLPFWLILSAAAVDRLWSLLEDSNRWLATAVLALLVADAAGAHLMYYQINMGNRPDWRGAFTYVASNMQPGDVVVTTRQPVGAYYLRTSALSDGEVVDMVDFSPESLSSSASTVWFVTDSEGIWAAPPSTRQWLDENADLLSVRYLRMREQIDLKIYRYQSHSPQGE